MTIKIMKTNTDDKEMKPILSHFKSSSLLGMIWSHLFPFQPLSHIHLGTVPFVLQYPWVQFRGLQKKSFLSTHWLSRKTKSSFTVGVVFGIEWPLIKSHPNVTSTWGFFNSVIVKLIVQLVESYKVIFSAYFSQIKSFCFSLHEFICGFAIWTFESGIESKIELFCFAKM